MTTNSGVNQKHFQEFNPEKPYNFDVRDWDLAPWESQDCVIKETAKTPNKTANRNIDLDPNSLKYIRPKTAFSPQPRRLMTTSSRAREHPGISDVTTTINQQPGVRAATTNTEESLPYHNIFTPTPTRMMNQSKLQTKQVYANNFARLPLSKKPEEHSFRIKKVPRLHSQPKSRGTLDHSIDSKNRGESPYPNDQTLEMIYNTYVANQHNGQILVPQQPNNRLRSTSSKFRNIIKKSPKATREGMSAYQVETGKKDFDDLILTGHSPSQNKSFESRLNTSAVVGDKSSPWMNANCFFPNFYPKFQRKAKKLALMLNVPESSLPRSRLEAYNGFPSRKTVKNCMDSFELESTSRSVNNNSLEVDRK
mgnify:CR=1 FL=1